MSEVNRLNLEKTSRNIPSDADFPLDSNQYGVINRLTRRAVLEALEWRRLKLAIQEDRLTSE